jgi:hypothetical protein
MNLHMAHDFAGNLTRWLQSGGARRWVDAHRGRWDHDAWLRLLDELRHAPFWPLDPGAVGRALEEAAARRHNLRRWEWSGQARAWVASRGGRWDHADWLALLDELARSPFWPLDPDAVGEVLEEIKREWTNLHRWEESGEARRWVAEREGRWTSADWPALAQELRRRGCWPADREAAEELVGGLASEWDNLRRWQASGQPRRWVEQHEARWDQDDWLALLDGLRQSEFWPLPLDRVSPLLEEMKQEWWNLRRWRDSGLAYRWVESRGGQWGGEDWPALRASLRQAGMWPVHPADLAWVMAQVRAEWENLRRWRMSGESLRWLASRQGKWNAGDVRDLLAALHRSEFWPLNPRAVRRLLDGLRPTGARAA